MINSKNPILYSFRRCPYAIRARMALYMAGIGFWIREVKLSDKPKQLLALSPKGTVPVLVLSNGRVIDESINIIAYAAKISANPMIFDGSHELTEICDKQFKPMLDRYKYSDRFSHEGTQADFRQQALDLFIEPLDERLKCSDFLSEEGNWLTDIAIFPFIRQFAMVDMDWFLSTPYVSLQSWLKYWLNSKLFLDVMMKLPVWCESEENAYWMAP